MVTREKTLRIDTYHPYKSISHFKRELCHWLFAYRGIRHGFCVIMMPLSLQCITECNASHQKRLILLKLFILFLWIKADTLRCQIFRAVGCASHYGLSIGINSVLVTRLWYSKCFHNSLDNLKHSSVSAVQRHIQILLPVPIYVYCPSSKFEINFTKMNTKNVCMLLYNYHEIKNHNNTTLSEQFQ